MLCCYQTPYAAPGVPHGRLPADGDIAGPRCGFSDEIKSAFLSRGRGVGRAPLGDALSGQRPLRVSERPRLRPRPRPASCPAQWSLREDAALLVAETRYDHAPVGIKIISRFSRWANVGFQSARGEPGRAWPPFSRLLAALAEPTIKLAANSDVLKRMLKRCAN